TICEVPFDDWPLEGPRTMSYWCKELAKVNLDPVARHGTWRHDNTIRDDEKMGMQHEILSDILEQALCVDQLDVSNCASFECLVRHLQLIESDVKKKVESKSPFAMNEYFLGRNRRTGGAIISPALIKWVADKAAQDSSILKEQRKAAEERAIRNKNNKEK
ncbi:unnamed protein product, partial [Polarella glacialis]